MCDQKRVLIVDDDEQIRFGAQRRLEAAGYATSLANDGDIGVELAEQQQPDLVLMDVQMPRMDGLTALCSLKNNPVTSGIPVVMLSASPRDQRKSLDSGARFFVRKPYSSQQLLTAIEHAMSSGS